MLKNSTQKKKSLTSWDRFRKFSEG